MDDVPSGPVPACRIYNNYYVMKYLLRNYYVISEPASRKKGL